MATIQTLFHRLVLYRVKQDSLLYRLGAAMDVSSGADVLSDLLTEAVTLGLEGNLWQCILTQSLLLSENAFSLSCERREVQPDSLWQFALEDMNVYLELFHKDSALLNLVRDFRHAGHTTEVGEQIMFLSKKLAACQSAEELLCTISQHYASHGLGMLGLGQVFRIDDSAPRATIYPVENRRKVHLADLVGYEEQKKQLLDNTLSFLSGKHANNVLLYGDAGTGKSTSVQAITVEYADRGLRLIEVYKHQFHRIPEILSQIKGRNYRFILFLDDLSFEENETEYKSLKAVMEGGAEAAPENVRIYATSNRRHLVKETWNDRNDMEHNGDIHRSETMEEKLSLASRFGLQIFYPNPTFDEYHEIVQKLAERQASELGLDAAQLRTAASTWQVRHGSRSGRTAQQFIDSLGRGEPQ